jgi:uncharacterized membrane protein YcaP (DUF421 family)
VTQMKISDFLIGLVIGIIAFAALSTRLGTVWSALIALFVGGSALLLSNAFRMTQGTH